MKKRDVLHPCIGCIYYKSCGNTNRTQRCDGSVTKTEKQSSK